jgi:hypothetical protein
MLKHRRGWATPKSPSEGVQREVRRHHDGRLTAKKTKKT